MSLFSFFYGSPSSGHEIRPDEPRKKGLARWWECVSRDLGAFMAVGLLTLAGMLPYLFGLHLAVVSHALLVLLVCCVAGGLIAGPFWYGLTDTLLRGLRDEPGFWWYRWKRTVQRNWKDSLLPGALSATVYGLQIFMLFHLPTDGSGRQPAALLLLSFALATGICVWMWAVCALLKLPFAAILRNAAILFFANPARTILAILFIGGYLASLVLFLPASMLALPFLNLWFPSLCALLSVYRPLEKAFNIESSVHELHESERQGAAREKH